MLWVLIEIDESIPTRNHKICLFEQIRKISTILGLTKNPFYQGLVKIIIHKHNKNKDMCNKNKDVIVYNAVHLSKSFLNIYIKKKQINISL